MKKYLVALTASLTLLTGCSSNSVTKSKEPLAPSQAFAQEGIWFRTEDKLEKDSSIRGVFVFNGKKEVKYYSLDDYSSEALKISDVNGKSKDEVLKIVEEKDKRIFEKNQKKLEESVKKNLEEKRKSLKKFETELSTGSYKEKPGYFSSLEFLDIENLQNTIKNISEEIKNNETWLASIEPYKAPEFATYSLEVETDGTGNNTQGQKLIFKEYRQKSEGYHSSTDTFKDVVDSYEDLKPIFAPYTIFDKQYHGYKGLYIAVEKEHAGFKLDTPKTEGVKIVG